jgi:hypothetical protein
MHIDGYAYGKMTVDGRVYKKDLIIFPENIRSDWWRKRGHSLAVEDLKDIIEFHPDTLIVGTGESAMLRIPRPVREELKNRKIGLIEKDTARASAIFNLKIKQGKRIAAAFHLTC